MLRVDTPQPRPGRTGLPERASDQVTLDGCWVTLWATGSAVGLDASGAVVDQVAFGKGSEPHGLAVTPDRNLWVALETGARAYVHS
jgi:virginiamycin B lyase